MNTTPQILRILPEVVMVVTGVLIMLTEPFLARDRSRRPMGWIAVAGTIAAIFASLYQYRLPDGTAFFGAVQTDAFSIFFHILILGISLVSILTAMGTTDKRTGNMGEFYALMVLGTVGMLFMTCAAGLLLIFIGLEISSISSYTLSAINPKSAKSPEAGLKYFLLGSFAAAFFLYGIALTFGATGTTHLDAIGRLIVSGHASHLAFAGMALMVIGFAFKVSAAPFQVWTPDTYEGAPSPVVALMSTGPKAAAFAVLLRILYEIFPMLYHHWEPILWWLAVLSMFVGNLGALRQRNLKRMLAYSSIAHAGYILVAFTAFSRDGIAAVAFYTASYAAMNVGAFVVVSHAGEFNDRLTQIEDFRGLGYCSPLLGGSLALSLISLIGIPFTGGFFGKFYVFTSAIHSGAVALTILGLINSGFACYYYLRVIAVIYTKPRQNSPLASMPRVTMPLTFALLITAAATLILGIAPGRVLARAQDAGQTLLSQPALQAAAQATTTNGIQEINLPATLPAGVSPSAAQQPHSTAKP